MDIGICLGAMLIALATVWTHPLVYLSMVDDTIPTASLILVAMLVLLAINHSMADYYGDEIDG